jgi:hypothetical protein
MRLIFSDAKFKPKIQQALVEQFVAHASFCIGLPGAK